MSELFPFAWQHLPLMWQWQQRLTQAGPWDMLEYMRLLVREAQKYGGSGRITYDQVFWHNRQGAEAHFG